MKRFTRLEPTEVYEVGGKFKRQVVIKRFMTDDGKNHEFTTLLAEGRRAVNVLALTADNQVVIAKQFRPSVERYQYDTPGGGAYPGEELEAAVRRELLEETGYSADHFEPLGHYSLDAAINLEVHNFLALNCQKVAEPLLDETENDQGLSVELISIDDLMYNAKHNRMTNGLIVLQAYDILLDLNKKGEKT